MSDKIEGFLEVGPNDHGEVVINYKDLTPDENGVGHIVFSPNQARNLAALLLKHAGDIEVKKARDFAESQRRTAEAIPVDRSDRRLVSGAPVSEDHREINPATGQQKDYVVLSAAERSKGFVRPVRRTYTHKKCGVDTTMSLEIAETYARDPSFYNGTFCVSCRAHSPLIEFVWKSTDEQVGS